MNKDLFFYFIAMQLILSMFSMQEKPLLKFNSNNNFTILQITDLHYGEDSLKDINTTKLITFLIEQSKADFVLISGDAVSGYAWDGKNQTFYQNLWNQFTSPMVLKQVPYALVLGNHDISANLNGLEIMKLDIINALSYSNYTTNISHASNFFIQVQSFDISNITPPLTIWGLDTGSNGCNNHSNGYGCIEKDQIDWFINQYDKHKGLYNSMFFHIPLQEYVSLLNNYPIYDWAREEINCPLYNTGFFSTAIQFQIQSMFCGHDHLNDYGGFIDGIQLGYGRKTGYSGYGPAIEQGEQRGGRVFQFQYIPENDEVKMYTYILQEDGSQIQTQLQMSPYKQQSCVCSLNRNYINFKNSILKKGQYYK